MYDLNGDQWILPVGLVQHIADMTIGAARGILAIRSEEAGLPKQILPLINPGQILKNNISFKRVTQGKNVPISNSGGNA